MTAAPAPAAAAIEAPDFERIAATAHRNLIADPCKHFWQVPLEKTFGISIDFAAFDIGLCLKVPYAKMYERLEPRGNQRGDDSFLGDGRHHFGDYTFPERDATGKIIGLALRKRWPTDAAKSKWAYTGGQRGLFYAFDPRFSPITEQQIEAERECQFRAVVSVRPPAIAGQAGNAALMLAINDGNRFGLSQQSTLAILKDEFNPRCQPQWSNEELERAITSQYAKNAIEHGTRFASPTPTASPLLARHTGPILICEGQSDTLTADVLGFDAVGLPSADKDGIDDDLTKLLRPLNRPVVLMADNELPGTGHRDGLGLRKAKKHAKALAAAGLQSKIVVPPRKQGVSKADLRSWVTSGGATHDSIVEAIEAATIIEPDAEPAAKPEPQAAKLVGVARSCDEFFHDAGTPYVRARILEGRFETMEILGEEYAELLGHRAYKEFGTLPGPQVIATAQSSLAGFAKFECPSCRVFNRIAHAHGLVYLDLVNDARQVVTVTGDGWRVLPDSECPVHFVRPKGMLQLPPPTEGGRLDELRPFLSLPEDQWPSYAGFVLSLFLPTGTLPILGLGGTQDSGKSTKAEVAKRLVDPHKAPLRNLSDKDDDFAVAAKNNHLLAFDNVSHISESTSDRLCRASTGGSFATRTFYHQGAETLIDIHRSIIVNGISPGLFSREDLRSRVLLVRCPAIEQSNRLSQDEFWTEFNSRHPRILGAILACVSTALRRLPDISPAWRPRMLDFYKWILAAEPATGLDEGAFAAALKMNEADAVETATENSVVAGTILMLVDRSEFWSGSCEDLLAEIHRPGVWDRRDLPKSPKAVSTEIERVKPALRSLGVSHERPSRTKAGRPHLFRRIVSVPPTHHPKGATR
jgi:hypothetical protein